jgi:hypothetical protein
MVEQKVIMLERALPVSLVEIIPGPAEMIEGGICLGPEERTLRYYEN